MFIMPYYYLVLPNYMHTEPEREYAHQNELSVKTLTRPLKSVSQYGMPVAVMVFAGPRPSVAKLNSQSRNGCHYYIFGRQARFSRPRTVRPGTPSGTCALRLHLNPCTSPEERAARPTKRAARRLAIATAHQK